MYDLYTDATTSVAQFPTLGKDTPLIAWSQELTVMLANGTSYPFSPYSPVPDSAARDQRHAYYAAVSYVDEHVGAILAAVEAAGLAANTLVVFHSDHGYALGEVRVRRERGSAKRGWRRGGGCVRLAGSLCLLGLRLTLPPPPPSHSMATGALQRWERLSAAFRLRAKSSAPHTPPLSSAGRRNPTLISRCGFRSSSTRPASPSRRASRRRRTLTSSTCTQPLRRWLASQRPLTRTAPT